MPDAGRIWRGSANCCRWRPRALQQPRMRRHQRISSNLRSSVLTVWQRWSSSRLSGAGSRSAHHHCNASHDERIALSISQLSVITAANSDDTGSDCLALRKCPFWQGATPKNLAYPLRGRSIERGRHLADRLHPRLSRQSRQSNPHSPSPFLISPSCSPRFPPPALV